LTVHRNGLYDVVFDDNSDAVDLPPNRIRKMTEENNEEDQQEHSSAEDDNKKKKQSPRKADQQNKKSSSSPRSASPTRQTQNHDDSEAEDEEQEVEEVPKSNKKKKQESSTAVKTKVPLFAVGDQVEARREGQQKYRFAVIAKVYDDNTYDVVYSDRFRERLEADMIQFPFGEEHQDEGNAVQKEEQQPANSKRPSASNNSKDIKQDKDNKRNQSSSSNCPFKVGMKVEARYQAGRVYYPGQITALNVEEETATIVYEDGDEESLVPFAFIMVPPQDVRSNANANSNSSQSRPSTGNANKSMLNKKLKFPIGTKVEGNYRGTGKWYPGVIADIREEDGDYIYCIDYNDGDKDENMSEDRLREPKPRRPTGKPTAPSKESNVDHDDDEGVVEDNKAVAQKKSSPLKNRNKTTAAAPSSNESTSPSKAAAIGINSIRIEGNYANQGTWYPGHILRERPNGRVDIQYDDGDREENVPLDRIRRLLPNATSPSKGRSTSTSNSTAADDVEESYMEGDRVEGNFHNSGEYYPGRVTKVKTDATTGLRYVDILYDDGDNEKGVPLSRVRKLPMKKSKNQGSNNSNNGNKGQKKQQSKQHHDDTTDGDDEEAIERETRERLTSKGKNKRGNSKTRQNQNGDGEVADPVDGGALIEMRDSDKKWYLGRIVNVNQNKGHATIRLLHTGEIRQKIQFNLIRLPRSTVTLKETEGQSAVAGSTASNGFVELNARDIQALRALLQEKDEEISRLRKMVKQLELNEPGGNGGNHHNGVDNNIFNQEIAALKKSNEDLKNSVVFLGEKFSLVVDELVKVKTKNNQLSKQIKAQGEEMNRWKTMGYGSNTVVSTPKIGRTTK
jgi:hypothetical protein